MATAIFEIPNLLVWRQDGTKGYDEPESLQELNELLGKKVSPENLQDFNFRHAHGISLVFGKVTEDKLSDRFFELDIVDIIHAGEADRYAFVQYQAAKKDFVLVTQDGKELPMAKAIKSPSMYNYYSSTKHKTDFKRLFPFFEL